MRRSTALLCAACLLAVFVLMAAQPSFACPSCYGAADSAETEGVNWAILSLLGITGTVLFGVSALFISLRKRALEFNRRFSDRLN
jgi:hypothetical protein